MRMVLEVSNREGDIIKRDVYPDVTLLPSVDDVIEDWPVTGAKICLIMELTPDETEAMDAAIEDKLRS